MNKCIAVREATIEEEIKSLEIEENTKKRILEKVEKLEKEYGKQSDYLINCYGEIDRLKCAIIEQAKLIGKQADEIRNMRID